MSNLGGMRNSGIEVDLHSLNIQAGDFNWGTDFNISFNKNEITSYPEEQEVVGTKVRTVGYSLYEFYMQEWAGVDKETGAPLWYKDVKMIKVIRQVKELPLQLTLLQTNTNLVLHFPMYLEV